MFTPESTRRPSASRDRELGLAALLLLVSVVLTVAFLPAYL